MADVPYFRFTTQAAHFEGGVTLPWQVDAETPLALHLVGAVYQNRGVDWETIAPNKLRLLNDDIPLGLPVDVFLMSGVIVVQQAAGDVGVVTTFDELRKHVLRNAHTNPTFYGEGITYTSGGTQEAFNANVVHRQEWEADAVGGEVLIEEIKVHILLQDWASPPKAKDRIYRSGEGRAYLFHAGKTTKWKHVAWFRRRLVKSQSVRT